MIMVQYMTAILQMSTESCKNTLKAAAIQYQLLRKTAIFADVVYCADVLLTTNTKVKRSVRPLSFAVVWHLD